MQFFKNSYTYVEKTFLYERVCHYIKEESWLFVGQIFGEKIIRETNYASAIA